MLHENRLRAESFGAIADLYDRARPTYPPALIDALLAGGARRVLDVGAGTGIASALLAQRGCEVLAVEIDERMAALARAKGIQVEVTRFEDWDDRGRRFELVVSAQAWHWIDPKVGPAKAAEVLEAGGRLGVFWNRGETPEDLRALLAATYAELEPSLQEEYSAIRGRHTRSEEDARAAIEACPAFGAVEVTSFPWTETYTTARWVERVATKSDHQTLPAERRERLLAAVAEALERYGGHLELEHDAVLVSAPRLPAAG